MLSQWVLFFLLAAIWGASYIAIKQVIHSWPIVFAAGMRIFLSMLFIALFAALQKRTVKLPRKVLPRVWLAGLFCQAIPFAFLYWGEKYISAGLSGILNGTVPLWTFVIGLSYAGGMEKFTWRKFTGILIGFLGIAVIFGPLLRGGEQTHDQVLGAMALLIMALSYGICNLLSRRILAQYGIDFWGNLFHQMLAGAVVLFAVSFVFEPRWPTLSEFFSLPPLLWSIYLGGVPSAIGWVIYFYLIREWSAVRASTVTYLVPLTAMMWDYVFSGTVPPGAELWGIGLILAGVVLIQWRRPRLR